MLRGMAWVDKYAINERGGGEDSQKMIYDDREGDQGIRAALYETKILSHLLGMMTYLITTLIETKVNSKIALSTTRLNKVIYRDHIILVFGHLANLHIQSGREDPKFAVVQTPLRLLSISKHSPFAQLCHIKQVPIHQNASTKRRTFTITYCLVLQILAVECSKAFYPPLLTVGFG